MGQSLITPGPYCPCSRLLIFEWRWEDAYWSLGIAYFYQHRYDDVIRMSDMQLEVMPANWYALAIKGFAFGLKGDWNKALEILLKAMNFREDIRFLFPISHFVTACLAIKRKHYQ
jgi:tetratricopeptide (TPR) repeat protein